MAKRHDEAKRTRASGAGRPRKTPRSSDRPVTEEILGEASRLFARQGVAATTMADVAEASGLQVSSLYYYFGSKHEILERILAEVNRVPLEALDDVVRTHPDAASRLHAFIRADVAALCAFPFDINEIHRLAGDDDGVFAGYWAERDELCSRVQQLVAAGIEAGDFVSVDPRLCALTILANDEAAQNWRRPAAAGQPGDLADYSPAAVGTFLADLAIRGLATTPAVLDRVVASATAEGQFRARDEPDHVD